MLWVNDQGLSAISGSFPRELSVRAEGLESHQIQGQTGQGGSLYWFGDFREETYLVL